MSDEDWTALATVVIAVFTVVLAISGGIQAWLTRKAINLARDEFIAAHPPHLVVRNVWSPDAKEGKPIEIEFEVINIGESNAIVHASRFAIHFVPQRQTFQTIPIPKVGETLENFIGEIVIKPGAVWRERSFISNEKWTADSLRDLYAHTEGLFWGGKILYRDKFRNPRRLGIFRRFEASSKRFRPVSDPEYEYDD